MKTTLKIKICAESNIQGESIRNVNVLAEVTKKNNGFYEVRTLDGNLYDNSMIIKNRVFWGS